MAINYLSACSGMLLVVAADCHLVPWFVLSGKSLGSFVILPINGIFTFALIGLDRPIRQHLQNQ